MDYNIPEQGTKYGVSLKTSPALADGRIVLWQSRFIEFSCLFEPCFCE